MTRAQTPSLGVAEVFPTSGEMAARMRAFRWSKSPLGAPEHWPSNLKLAVQLMLSAERPMAVWWGEALLDLHNDAACALLDAPRAQTVGEPATAVWKDHWQSLEPCHAWTRGVEASPPVEPRVVLTDDGGRSRHFGASCIRLPGVQGKAGGALLCFRDDTKSAVREQRFVLLRELDRRQASALTWSEVCEQVGHGVEENPCGISFAIVYLADPSTGRLILGGAAGIPPGHHLAPRSVSPKKAFVWPVHDVIATQGIRCLTGAGLPHDLPLGIGGRPAELAVALPVSHVRGEVGGALVVGLDDTNAYDDECRDFLEQVAATISAGIAQTMLARNQSAFQTLAMTAPAGIFMKDLRGRYVFANPLACEMMLSTTLLGRTDAEVLPAAAAERLAEQDRAVLQHNRSVECEEQIGDRVFLLLKFPWSDADGKPSGVYGVAIDISERKQMEEALRRNEQKYRAIGESIDYGVWICDEHGHNIYASDSFLKLTGLTQEECSEFGWGRVLHPDDAEATLDAWRACVREGAVWDREHRVKGGDGRYHPVLARGVPIRDENGRIQRWAGINLDIGRLKAAEDELREADRRKDEFLSLLAHELRNPLAPICNALYLMGMTGLADSGNRYAHEVITRQVTHLVRLVDDLLDVGRITHGKLALRMERVSLRRAADAALEAASPHLAEKRHHLDVSIPPDLFLVADPVRLTQIIANLLINSAKYTPAGGRVSLEARSLRDGVDIRVSDNGIGFPAAFQPRVFEMFSQFRDTAAGSVAGLGIGLALVKSLAEVHGGSVSAMSEGVGRGSTFTVWLPVEGHDASRLSSSASDHAAQSTRCLHVLVVDDNEDAAESMSALLGLLGHEARTAHDGYEAVEEAKTFRPDLILMDIGMPGMDGYRTTEHIRALELGKRPVVVAVTGWNYEAVCTEAQTAGIDRHVVKPIDIGALQEILGEL